MSNKFYFLFIISLNCCIITINLTGQLRTIRPYENLNERDTIQNNIASKKISDTVTGYSPIYTKENTTLGSTFQPLDRIIIVSGFGLRFHPIEASYEYHNGVDLKARFEKVYSFANGIVERAGYENGSGYYIIIRHTINITSSYSHLRNILVKEGQNVFGGEIIAISGNSGKSTGPHLHFAIKYKQDPINPVIVLKNAKFPFYD